MKAIFVCLCVALLAAQFWALRVPQYLHLPEQQHVATNNPKIGVHTRLTGIGDEAYIEQSLRQVREMGASWIVDLFPWAYVQPRSRYGFDWAGSDMIIKHAARQGLQVVARIDIVPQWARPADTNDRYLDPDHYVDYADYVVAFLQRYRPYGVRHVIIWNEPNLDFEWGQRPPDPGAYAALLKVVYPRVHAAVPDAVVIAGALSPGPDLGDGTKRMGDAQYLASLYDAQAAPFFDMLAVHNYGYKSGPDAPANESEVNFRRVEVVHDEMKKFGDGDKQIIMTEGGWNDSIRWTAGVLPSQRLRWTVEAYQLAQQWPWLAAMCMWQLGTPQPTHTYQDNWSFIASDGTPKAIYWAVQEAAVPGKGKR
ncbi:MAG TPA: hypothetical protein VFT66_00015 [Roseiflexaceae bacterium]|jgi:hypothetical protein|nr:hypothetical protein [Roseiflexaceae bacterium]